MKLLEAIANAHDCEGARSGAPCSDCLPPAIALRFMEELDEAREKLRRRRKRVMPGSEYLDDGSMVCPFGRKDVGGKPCDYHTFSGCSWD